MSAGPDSPAGPPPATPPRARAAALWLALLAAAVPVGACLGAALSAQPASWTLRLVIAAAIGGAGIILLAATMRARDVAPAATPEPARSRIDDGDDDRGPALATLAAGLSHELGQPLSAARVGIEGLHYLRQLGREPSAEHVNRTLAQVGMSLIAMTQTIEHLRALAGPDAGARLQDVDLTALVEAVLAERDQWLRYRDVSIAWIPPARAVHAQAEPAGLRLVLVNLLRNAAEAVAGQGEGRRHLRITVGEEPSVAVHDSGPGIPAEHVRRLFDPFFTTKSGVARGIGLSLAQASAKRMGAELTAASALGAGSTFTLRLKPAVAVVERPGERP